MRTYQPFERIMSLHQDILDNIECLEVGAAELGFTIGHVIDRLYLT